MHERGWDGRGAVTPSLGLHAPPKSHIQVIHVHEITLTLKGAPEHTSDTPTTSLDIMSPNGHFPPTPSCVTRIQSGPNLVSGVVHDHKLPFLGFVPMGMFVSKLPLQQLRNGY